MKVLIIILVICTSSLANSEVAELLYPTFRGNNQRNSVGTGTLPANPEVLWRYPDKKMCGKTKVGGKTVTWCGTGWTGQPLAYKSESGEPVLTFGSYDHGVHFVKALSGKTHLPTFYTEDIIKGTGTIGPDGLMAIGSRDNYLRVLRLSGDRVEQLWALNGNVKGGIWNNDWDASPIIYQDYLIAGGENGWMFIYKLNKEYIDGQVVVSPEKVVRIPGFDQALVKKVGDRNMSIENSVIYFEDRIYFANSAGMIWGYDFKKLLAHPEDYEQALVYKFWAGDDIDATMVIDEMGHLYVGVELERVSSKYNLARSRSKQVGQVLKLNPYKWNGDRTGQSLESLEWSIPLKIIKSIDKKAGVWATPALVNGSLYVSTHTGRFMAIDTENGNITWEADMGYHAWASPVVTDDKKNLIVAGCKGEIRNYAIDGDQPRLVWEYIVPGAPCIESTPLVLDRAIYVGTRDGYFYSIGDR